MDEVAVLPAFTGETAGNEMAADHSRLLCTGMGEQDVGANGNPLVLGTRVDQDSFVPVTFIAGVRLFLTGFLLVALLRRLELVLLGRQLPTWVRRLEVGVRFCKTFVHVFGTNLGHDGGWPTIFPQVASGDCIQEALGNGTRIGDRHVIGCWVNILTRLHRFKQLVIASSRGEQVNNQLNIVEEMIKHMPLGHMLATPGLARRTHNGSEDILECDPDSWAIRFEIFDHEMGKKPEGCNCGQDFLVRFHLVLMV